MADDLDEEAFRALNGEPYIVNDTGEVEVDENYQVPTATTMPGHGDADTFIADI